MGVHWDKDSTFARLKCDSCGTQGPGIHVAKDPAIVVQVAGALGWTGLQDPERGGAVYFVACGKRCAAGAPPPPPLTPEEIKAREEASKAP